MSAQPRRRLTELTRHQTAPSMPARLERRQGGHSLARHYYARGAKKGKDTPSHSLHESQSLEEAGLLERGSKPPVIAGLDEKARY
jgi:hypothetical protein